LTADRPSVASVRIEAGDSAHASVILAGAWRVDSPRDGTAAALQELARPGLRRIIVRDDGITAWDSTLLTFLRAVEGLARSGNAELDVTGLPEGVRRLLNLASAVPERAGARRVTQSEYWVTKVGKRTIKGFQAFGDAMRFFGELTMAFGAMLRGKARYRRSDLLVVMQECGPEALPIITLISLLVGMILAFLGAVQLKMFGAEVFIANAVAIGMVREMGALMTGILMAGRTGAAFAARLGTMQVNEEVDALQTMGFSPMEFLVLPRALALIIMMPLLAIYANVVGILGGAVIGVFMLDLTPAQYYHQTLASIHLPAVATGLIKSAVFGILVAVSGCLQGIRCGRSAEAVGDATTSAVVNAIVYIVVADSILSILFIKIGM